MEKWLKWYKENVKELLFNPGDYDFQIQKPDTYILGFDEDENWYDDLQDKRTKNYTLSSNLKAQYEPDLKKKFLAYIRKHNLDFDTVQRLQKKRDKIKSEARDLF
jgi:hypothetical protein